MVLKSKEEKPPLSIALFFLMGSQKTFLCCFLFEGSRKTTPLQLHVTNNNDKKYIYIYIYLPSFLSSRGDEREQQWRRMKWGAASCRGRSARARARSLPSTTLKTAWHQSKEDFEKNITRTSRRREEGEKEEDEEDEEEEEAAAAAACLRPRVLRAYFLYAISFRWSLSTWAGRVPSHFWIHRLTFSSFIYLLPTTPPPHLRHLPAFLPRPSEKL